MARTAKKKNPAIKTQVQAKVGTYGWCRANMHIWVPQHSNGLVVENKMVKVVFKCNTCTAERHDKIVLSSGDLFDRAYHYPEDYKLHLPKGEKQPPKADWRREHYKALLSERG